MATECDGGVKNMSQVKAQCDKFSKLNTELSEVIQSLEKRLEPALSSAHPVPEETKGEEDLCPLAGTLCVLTDVLAGQITSLRVLTERIEV
jgi:hypothetical protein